MAQKEQPPSAEKKLSIPYGKLVSLTNFICLLTVVPKILKMVWPTLLEYFTGPWLYLCFVLFVSVVILGLHNIVMIFIYRAKYPFFEQYRCHNKPWPWEKNYSSWLTQLKKTFKTISLNIFIINPLIIGFEQLTSGFLYHISVEEWPTPFEILYQFCFFILMMDTLFYISHSILHRPEFYWIHKQHHEYSTTIMLTTSYAHPLEFVFGNALAIGFGHMLLARIIKVHLITMVVWYIFVTLETCEGHSGYDWSWSQLSFLPFKTSPRFHDFHHSHNCGNYGSMFLWSDSLLGTDKQYNKHIKSSKQTA